MFENLILEKHPTGSNYICNPPVTTTDIDFVCLLNEGDLKVAKAFAIADGWELCGKEYTPRDFLAFRKDKLNYICVDKEEIYNKWIAATEEAKSLNLLNKEDRIKCFNRHLGVKENKKELWIINNEWVNVPIQTPRPLYQYDNMVQELIDWAREMRNANR